MVGLNKRHTKNGLIIVPEDLFPNTNGEGRYDAWVPNLTATIDDLFHVDQELSMHLSIAGEELNEIYSSPVKDDFLLGGVETWEWMARAADPYALWPVQERHSKKIARFLERQIQKRNIMGKVFRSIQEENSVVAELILGGTTMRELRGDKIRKIYGMGAMTTYMLLRFAARDAQAQG